MLLALSSKFLTLCTTFLIVLLFIDYAPRLIQQEREHLDNALD